MPVLPATYHAFLYAHDVCVLCANRQATPVLCLKLDVNISAEIYRIGGHTRWMDAGLLFPIGSIFTSVLAVPHKQKQSAC